MKHCGQRLLPLLFILLSVVTTQAAGLPLHDQTAKVYRDYPAYIEPPTCEAPCADKKTAAGSGGQPYLAVWGGLGALADDDLDFQAAKLDASYKHGYAAGAALGYDFGAWRLEVDGSYRHNNIETLELAGFELAEDGSVEIEALILNGYYDWENSSSATPYLGVGAGWARVSLDGVKAFNIPLVDDDDSVWAAQAAAGLRFDLTRNLALDLGYRYLMTDDLELKSSLGRKVETGIRHHAVILGLQLKF